MGHTLYLSKKATPDPRTTRAERREEVIFQASNETELLNYLLIETEPTPTNPPLFPYTMNNKFSPSLPPLTRQYYAVWLQTIKAAAAELEVSDTLCTEYFMPTNTDAKRVLLKKRRSHKNIMRSSIPSYLSHLLPLKENPTIL